MITSIKPIVCGQVIISLTIDSGEKAAQAARIEKICGTALARISQLCDEAGISYTHMYIWRRDCGFAVNAAGYLRYRRWARNTGSRPVLHRQM